MISKLTFFFYFGCIFNVEHFFNKLSALQQRWDGITDVSLLYYSFQIRTIIKLLLF